MKGLQRNDQIVQRRPSSACWGRCRTGPGSGRDQPEIPMLRRTGRRMEGSGWGRRRRRRGLLHGWSKRAGAGVEACPCRRGGTFAENRFDIGLVEHGPEEGVLSRNVYNSFSIGLWPPWTATPGAPPPGGLGSDRRNGDRQDRGGPDARRRGTGNRGTGSGRRGGGVRRSTAPSSGGDATSRPGPSCRACSRRCRCWCS